ncbi:hypothetical protein ACVWWG_001713 [Bradyrhizobium sp. LB7.2]
MIDQSTLGSTIDHAKIATKRSPSDQISTVSGPRFVKLCRKSKRPACTCFRFAWRSDSRWPLLGQRPAELSVRAVLDKREAKAVLHNGTTRTHLSHSFAHVAAPSPFCPTTAKRLRHVQRRCGNQRSLLLEKPSGVYDPEDLASLGNLFDRAIASLPTCMRTSENRAAIARLVMQRAARDELASLANLMLALVSAG